VVTVTVGQLVPAESGGAVTVDSKWKPSWATTGTTMATKARRRWGNERESMLSIYLKKRVLM